MSLATEYRGYTIRYSENEDKWTCYDIGRGDAVTAATLSAMKGKVDKYLLGIRKEAAVACIEISETYFNFTDATIIEYIGPKIEGGGWDRKPRHVASHSVAAMALRFGNDRVSRQERALTSFAPIGPATDAAIAEATRLKVIADDARKAFDAAVKAIPRLTLDDVAELVRVSGKDPTGGLKAEGGEA